MVFLAVFSVSADYRYFFPVVLAALNYVFFCCYGREASKFWPGKELFISSFLKEKANGNFAGRESVLI